MTPTKDVSRRRFIGATLAALGASTTAGCSTFSGDDGLDVPDYEMDAVQDVLSQAFPRRPAVFPVGIPQARFDAHEGRTRDLLDSVPVSPEIPNEAIANRIAHEREHLAGDLGDDVDERRPRERLDRWRYYRTEAAEVWGAYVAATDQYTSRDFRNRYERLRSQYTDFDQAWDYRGRDAPSALVVHRVVEHLVESGTDAVLSTGRFPGDPQAAVFEAARMIRAHERAAATLGDANEIRSQNLAGQSDPPSQRLRFVAASNRLSEGVRYESRSNRYERALEHGSGVLDTDLERGPDAEAFETARRYAVHGDRAVAEARARNDPATATILAARYQAAHTAFRDTLDAILADEITWPDDVDGLRTLRAEAIDSLESAWKTDPQPLAVELTATPVDALGAIAPHWYESHVDDHDIARYVGVLHYVKRLAATIPAVTADVVDALTAP